MRELLCLEFLEDHQDLGINLTVVGRMGETVYVEGLLEGMILDSQEDFEARKPGIGQGACPHLEPTVGPLDY